MFLFFFVIVGGDFKLAFSLTNTVSQTLKIKKRHLFILQCHEYKRKN